MKKISLLFVIIVLSAASWWFGKPGNPPAPISTTSLSRHEKGNVKGVSSDRVAPTSHLVDPPKLAGKNTQLSGEAFDLGSGVASVVYQVQRSDDGAVWDGNKWQENVGSVLEAKLDNNKFTFLVPVTLLKDEKYVIRVQAMDRAGNAQTKWSEYTFTGQDLSEDNRNI
jgi:hypothetical protein